MRPLIVTFLLALLYSHDKTQNGQAESQKKKKKKAKTSAATSWQSVKVAVLLYSNEQSLNLSEPVRVFFLVLIFPFISVFRAHCGIKRRGT